MGEIAQFNPPANLFTVCNNVHSYIVFGLDEDGDISVSYSLELKEANIYKLIGCLEAMKSKLIGMLGRA